MNGMMEMRGVVPAVLTGLLLGYLCLTAIQAVSSGSMTDSEVSGIIHKTMQQVHADLKELKLKFPQLSEIESASVTSNLFRYSKGWEKDSKVKGTTFGKDGCDVLLRVQYPAEAADAETQLAGSPFMKLANGKRLLFWHSARAEDASLANAFKAEVEQLLTRRISEMLRRLGNGPKDFVRQLPEQKPNQ